MKQSISMPIALLTILSCSDGELFVLPIEESAEATVPAADPLTGNLVDLVGDLGFSQFSEMEISESEELQNQGVAPGDITTVTLLSFDLEVSSPEGGDLSFLSSVNVYVNAAEEEQLLIAHLDSFPEGESAVTFDLETVELAPYVLSDSMSISTDVLGTLPEEETVVVAQFALEVGVTKQGACNALSNEQDSGE